MSPRIRAVDIIAQAAKGNSDFRGFCGNGRIDFASKLALAKTLNEERPLGTQEYPERPFSKHSGLVARGA
jgi:hypothetical protein